MPIELQYWLVLMVTLNTTVNLILFYGRIKKDK